MLLQHLLQRWLLLQQLLLLQAKQVPQVRQWLLLQQLCIFHGIQSRNASNFSNKCVTHLRRGISDT